MSFLKRHKVSLSILGIIVVGVLVYQGTKKPEVPDWTTDTISKGIVRELVSVSGVIEAESEATLSFPISGTVGNILVSEGMVVDEGTVLATLEQNELLAEKRDAEGALMIANANLRELIEGPRSEERDVTAQTVTIARANLESAVGEERVKVQNAYRALLSNDLEALPENKNTTATPPTITGTYTCNKEGTYTLTFFRSGADSGYSYRMSGLETGSATGYSESSGVLGTCGLRMQIDADSNYGGQTWTIEVPNSKSPTYPTLLSAYLLAQETSDNVVTSAHDALVKAERDATLSNATPREEELRRREAAVVQASARIDGILARMNERTLVAPFRGTISDIDMTRGEASTGRTLSLIASSTFILTVRIPEIDITKVLAGQRVVADFDARQGEQVDGHISFISPVAREIDGVAYFEADIVFDTPPTWMRSGLNADVDIIVEESEEALRVPRRFLVTQGDASYLLYPDGVTTRREKVDVLFTGNDGFVSVSGNIREGDTIVAP